MSLICELTEVLVHSLLLYWIDVEDIGRLDTAICNRVQRAALLRIVAQDSFIVSRCFNPGDSSRSEDRLSSFSAWVVKRQIAVSNFAWASTLPATPKSGVVPDEARQTHPQYHR
jgi:hypothetical protein